MSVIKMIMLTWKLENSFNNSEKYLVIQTFNKDYLHSEKPENPQVKYDIKINLKHSSESFYLKPKYFSFSESNEVRAQIQNLLERKIIKPSLSEYAMLPKSF